MKPSKPTNSSSTSRSKPSRPSVRSARELHELQRAVGGAIMTSLTPRWGMQPASRPVADAFIKSNKRLTSFERLEIYNRQYWFRLIDCFYDDYPGLRAVAGDRKFGKLTRAYLAKYPSASFTLRNLGQYLEKFLRDEPRWTRPRERMALDMARLEWARVVAFDGEARPVVDIDDLLGANPAKLRLHLQPYLSLLELRYPLDDYLIALKKLSVESLRGEASNAVTQHAHRRVKQLRRPKAQTVYVAVHRMENAIYYKRLTQGRFNLLCALKQNKTLQQACTRVSNARAEDIQRWFETWASFGWFCQP
ncbi:MAG TPA: putative DNA-binding domain-containing protein [Verrucomicrobiae bacterium]|nr:putative DNA-binding domain-containing protein [Verrucomicrobiae bacterium]